MTRDETACESCQGIARERDGGRCQSCGGNGLRDGLTGYHPRYFNLHLRTICNGWRDADFVKITDMIEKGAAWLKTAGFTLEQCGELERTMVRKMIERQVVLGIKAGHFADVGIMPEEADHIFDDGRPIL